MALHRRKKYNTPKKGTKARRLVLALLKPKGLTLREMKNLLGFTYSHLAHLQDFGGWDIKAFIVDNPSPIDGKRHHKVYSYRIVGRLRFKGGYRSFVNDDIFKERDHGNGSNLSPVHAGMR